MSSFDRLNPFSRRESHSTGSITSYKVLTTLTWLLSLVVSVYYTVQDPRDGHTIRSRIWDLNAIYKTAFTMNATMAKIYWAVLFVFQAGYITHLFSSHAETVHAACSVGSHFIVNNLLHSAFVLLFVNNHFILAEIVLILNFFNLTSLYFRHNTYARSIHVPVVAMPLAWTFVAIYWNGAIMLHHPNHTITRIFGNIFIWSILAYGLFFIMVYKDYTMGFSLSTLAAAIGVGQFLGKMVALQWIFAFTIMGLLFITSLGVAVSVWQGRDWSWGRSQPVSDPERAPLINE